MTRKTFRQRLAQSRAGWRPCPRECAAGVRLRGGCVLADRRGSPPRDSGRRAGRFPGPATAARSPRAARRRRRVRACSPPAPRVFAAWPWHSGRGSRFGTQRRAASSPASRAARPSAPCGQARETPPETHHRHRGCGANALADAPDQRTIAFDQRRERVAIAVGDEPLQQGAVAQRAVTLAQHRSP